MSKSIWWNRIALLAIILGLVILGFSLVLQAHCLGTHTDLGVVQKFALGQLGNGHGEEVIQPREIFNLVLPIVIDSKAAKRVKRRVEHELRKYELAIVYGVLRRNQRSQLKHHV